MTNSLTELLLATLLFVATHILLSGRLLRPRLVAMLGERAFLGAYSLLSIALIIWVVSAYNHAPWVEVWPATTALRHLTLGAMVIAFVFIVTGFTTPNPSAVGSDGATVIAQGPVGIQKITRHPVMWGIAIWGVVHMLARGDAAGLILFGGMAVLALLGAWSLDAKKAAQLGDAWARYRAQTSFLPFAALIAGRARVSITEIGWRRIGVGVIAYAVFLALHGWIFGTNPWPL